MDTISDSGVAPLRSRLSIPVIGPGEVAWTIASLLGKNFSIVTLSEDWVPATNIFLAKAGVQDRLASVRSIDKVPDFSNLLSGDKEIFEDIKKAALLAINEDGAHVIVLGSTTMHEAYDYLSAELDCPVVNPGLWGIKFAEQLVQFGMSHSKLTYPSPPDPIDDVIFSRLNAIN